MQDWMSKLERAKALLDAGALSPEEFEAEKARLLPVSTSAQPDKAEPLVEELEEGGTALGSGWLKLGVAGALLAIATFGYVLFFDRSPNPSPQISNSTAPEPTSTSQAMIPKPVPTTLPVATQANQEFGCIGAYSDVSFSEESGDGSGLFIRIGKSGSITWKYYEGGISRGTVRVNKRSANSISATVRYIDYPNEQPSSVVLTCKDGRLSANSKHIGNLSLRRLTTQQAAELDR